MLKRRRYLYPKLQTTIEKITCIITSKYPLSFCVKIKNLFSNKLIFWKNKIDSKILIGTTLKITKSAYKIWLKLNFPVIYEADINNRLENKIKIK